MILTLCCGQLLCFSASLSAPSRYYFICSQGSRSCLPQTNNSWNLGIKFKDFSIHRDPNSIITKSGNSDPGTISKKRPLLIIQTFYSYKLLIHFLIWKIRAVSPLVLILHIDKSEGNLSITLIEVIKDITSALGGI